MLGLKLTASFEGIQIADSGDCEMESPVILLDLTVRGTTHFAMRVSWPAALVLESYL